MPEGRQVVAAFRAISILKPLALVQGLAECEEQVDVAKQSNGVRCCRKKLEANHLPMMHIENRIKCSRWNISHMTNPVVQVTTTNEIL